MKRHYFFYSFWSSLALALLSTQPGAAEPIVTVVASSTVRDITVKPATKSLRISALKKVHGQAGLLVRSQAQQPKTKQPKAIGKTTAVLPKTKQPMAQVGQKPQTPQPEGNNNTDRTQKLIQLLAQRSQTAKPDLSPRSTPVPNYLNPSPNPLRLPTNPEEVRVLGAEPITLQQALELARRNNRELQSAQLAIERSRAALREQQAALLPTLGIQAGVANQGTYILGDGTVDEINQLGQPFERDRGANTVGVNGDLSLNYDLFTSGRRSATIRAAEEQLRNDRLDFERISEETRLNVATDYYNLQQADENVRIQRASLANAQASLRDAQALEQAGVGTRFDVLTAQVQVARAQQRLTDALSQQRVARRQLATRLSLSESVTITAADPVEIAGLWNLTQEQSIVQAFQNRAELEQQLAQRNISQQRRRIALASIRPQVELAATYGVRDFFGSGGDDNNNDSGSDFVDNYSLGANVSLSLYDGGAARARARQEDANIAIAETNFASARNTIRFEVEQAFSNLQSNFDNIQTATVALEQAREALRLARLRFQAGVGTQTEVIDSEDRLTQAAGERVNAILSYNRAFAQLQRSISSGQQR